MTEPEADDEDGERRRRSREETKGQLARFRRWSTRRSISPRTGFRAAGKFPKTGRQRTAVSTTAEIPAGAYDLAGAGLGETLDSMNPYYEADTGLADGGDYEAAQDAPEIDREFDPPQNYSSLQL